MKLSILLPLLLLAGLVPLAAQTNTFPSSGNAGIGTTSPARPLHISGSGDIRERIESTSGSGYSALELYNDSGFGGSFFQMGSTGSGYGGANSTNLINIQNAPLVLGTANTVRLSILGNGNVGIGTSSPAQKLTVEGNSSSLTSALFTNASSTTTAINQIQLSSPNINVNMNAAFRLVGQSSGDLFRTSIVNNGTEQFTVLSGGNIGIGTTNPATRLHVADSSGAVQVGIGEPNISTASLSGYTISSWNNGNVYLDAKVITGGTIVYRYGEGAQVGAQNTWMTVKGGNVGIGTTTPGSYKLAVEGAIRARSVVVDNATWPDYVFDESYHLAPLSEVEAHIKAEKHLPGIPSAAEVAQGGVSLGDMQAKLLAKVEELMLHVIAQEKRNDAQQAEIAALRTQLARISTPN